MIPYMLSLALLAGCPKPGPVVVAADAVPEDVMERARAEAAPGPVYSNFTAVLSTENGRVTASGTLVVAAPNQFRVELRGPIGPPQLVVACDGTAVRAFVASKNTWYESLDANRDVGALLGAGDLPGAAIATALLLGRLPPIPEAPVLSAAGPVANLSWARSDGAALSIGLDGATAHLVDAHAQNAAGERLLDAAWVPGVWPEGLTLSLPTLKAGADVRFGSWQPATPTPAAFTLPQPLGSTALPFPFSPPG